MPGSPDPALGSELLTRVVALAAAVIAVAVPVVRHRGSPLRDACAFGAVYALCGLCCWLGARLLTNSMPSGLSDAPLSGVFLIGLGLLVLGAQAVVPTYAFRRYGVVGPLIALALPTGVVVYAFLTVRGETDPMGLYALAFGPLAVVGLAALAAVEYGVRRALDTAGPG